MTSASFRCLSISFFIWVCGAFNANAKEPEVYANTNVDFLHYDARLTPSFAEKSVQGRVTVSFAILSAPVEHLDFSANYKSLSQVMMQGRALKFEQVGEYWRVYFNKPLAPASRHQIQFDYKATPERGFRAYADHLFTVYHTQNWMVAHNNVADKASFDLRLVHDIGLTSAGNGKLIQTQTLGDGMQMSHWQQTQAVPIYTFGFALGKFESLTQQFDGGDVSYLFRPQAASGMTQHQVKTVYQDVGDMLTFFEAIAGAPLPNGSYRYVQVQGRMAQEADGFSLVGEDFAHTVLQDEHENWFIAHELAHEWWGNGVTCENFSHFWLNEGLVQFLVAAYKQRRFGEEAYMREIQLALTRVQRSVDKGRDTVLAFKQPIHESQINRSMVYNKGALVFYMLRKELGDDVFWRGLKAYTQTHLGGSVVSDDLKRAFERAANKDLNGFFDKWVYGSAVPESL